MQQGDRQAGSFPSEGTAVYVGIQQMEYGSLAAPHLPDMGAFTATGTPFSVAAGRLSFTYAFKGPSVCMTLYVFSRLSDTEI